MDTETVTIDRAALEQLLLSFAHEASTLHLLLDSLDDLATENAKVAAAQGASLMARRIGYMAERAAESCAVSAPNVYCKDEWVLGHHTERQLAALRPQ